VELLPEGDMHGLAGLLRRIIDASAAAPAPADTSHLRTSRRTDPGAGLSPAAQIDQYLTDLNGFRDDAHLAAWRPSEIDGAAWEALTLLWRGEADTPAALAEKLAGRRHDPAAYAAALHSLAERGWAAEQAGAYSLTEQGRTIRQQAEAETDRLFYEPWGSLDDSETHELRLLLTRLGDRARALADSRS
jgi:hypothetical protein